MTERSSPTVCSRRKRKPASAKRSATYAVCVLTRPLKSSVPTQIISILGKRLFLNSQIALFHTIVGQKIAGRVTQQHVARFHHVAALSDSQGRAGVLLDQEN